MCSVNSRWRCAPTETPEAGGREPGEEGGKGGRTSLESGFASCSVWERVGTKCEDVKVPSALDFTSLRGLVSAVPLAQCLGPLVLEL